MKIGTRKEEGTGTAISVPSTCQPLPLSLHTQLGSVLQSKDKPRSQDALVCPRFTPGLGAQLLDFRGRVSYPEVGRGPGNLHF